jgi:hypothetical protein
MPEIDYRDYDDQMALELRKIESYHSEEQVDNLVNSSVKTQLLFRLLT